MGSILFPISAHPELGLSPPMGVGVSLVWELNKGAKASPSFMAKSGLLESVPELKRGQPQRQRHGWGDMHVVTSGRSHWF